MSNTDIIADFQRVADVAQRKLITRTDYRTHGKFSDHAVQSEFGNFRAARRAAGLEETTGLRQQHNALARHTDHDAYRQMNIEKADYAEKYRKPTGRRFATVIAASDLHDEQCDPFWLRVFLDTIKRVQPDAVALGGDIVDLAEFGRYSVDPRDWDVVGKLRWMHKLLGDIREAAPDAEIVYISGNHEHRLFRYLTENAPAMKTLLSDLHGWGISNLLGLDKYEVRFVSRDNLATFNKSNVVKELAKNYEVFYDCFLVDHFPNGKEKALPGCNGHHHSHVVWNMHNHQFGSYEWHQLGSGHRRAAEYCDGSKWNMGFMTITIDTQNKLPHMDYHFIGDFSVVHGKHYLRSPNEV